MADSAGNDITAVAVPVTGFLGFAPGNTTLPTPSAGAAEDFVLPVAFKKVGLLKTDGGFEWTGEATGDPIEFWQDGYSLPSGLANVTIAAGLAQTDELTRSLVTGKTADVNGYITVDGGGHSTEYVFFTEEIFKNGVIRRRVAVGQVQSAKENRSTRGEVIGYDCVFKIRRHPSLNNEHYGEWLILPA
ncbi:MAG TPA: hypothetical protein VIL55_08660 [Naasia sp.]|jgi:hypothetical protein